jgi:sporulation protein YlmC with PRC-barrel domain
MALKKIEIISNEFTDDNALHLLSSYIGKEVYSKSGELVGVVKELVVHNDKIKGIIVNGKKEFYIDKESFKLNDHEVIILKLDPIFALIGKKVYDSDGRELGIVQELKRKSLKNEFTAMVVSKNLLYKNITIPRKEIESFGVSVILNKKYKND